MLSFLGKILPTTALVASVLLFLSIPKPIIANGVETCESNSSPPPPFQAWCCWCIAFDPEDPEGGSLCWKKTAEGEWYDFCDQEEICPEERSCGLGGGGS